MPAFSNKAKWIVRLLGFTDFFVTQEDNWDLDLAFDIFLLTGFSIAFKH
jgi:hypothetical protein